MDSALAPVKLLTFSTPESYTLPTDPQSLRSFYIGAVPSVTASRLGSEALRNF